MNTIKLTEYSHGAGCGCKISPMLLDEFLRLSTSLELDIEPIGETCTRGSHLIEVL